jgi:transglutaminase-like putative cysteine protease
MKTTLFERLLTLPRDTRDTLFLLLVIAWIIAPKAEYLPLWCSLMAAGILLWRGTIAWHGRTLPSRWWLLLALGLATTATWLNYRTLMGQEAGVTFLVVLLALKTLELRAQRDAFVVFFLGFFTLLSSFFVSQSLLTAGSMLIGLLGLLTALVNSHMPVGRPPLLRAAKTAGWMALLGAPIMAVLFVLFPRISPLWGMPSDTMSGRSGLSGTMSVGTIASLALDSSIAMRIRFDAAPPAQSEMYFRGPVLSRFNGREWRPLMSDFFPRAQSLANLQVQSEAVRYQVTLEANNRPWILVLDATPEKPDIKGYTPNLGSDLQWTSERPIADIVRYRAQSYPAFTYGPQTMVPALQEYLRLPAGFNPRTLELAKTLRNDPTAQGAGPQALVNAAMNRLRTGGYSYTLEPGVFGTHTADEFWFDRKAGFCEHIASSFVLLMRAMDIPARVVTGYQGGELNSVDGFWTVRQSDAHAWTEVWLAGRGWVRVDPTTAVAPARTGSLQRLEAPRNVFTRALVTVNPAFALNLRATWEAMNNSWNQWVLNYSQGKQLDLLRNLGFESPSWADLSYVLIAIVVAASLLGAAWTLWERHRQDPWLRLLGQAANRLRRAGLTIAANAPPRQLAAAVQQQLSPGAECTALQDWLIRLEAWRYAPAGQAVTLATLRHEFGRLPWPATPPQHAIAPLSR